MTVPDPEVLYGKLTSGDAGRVGDVAAALGDARSSLRTAMATIADGGLAAVKRWRGDAAAKFIGKVKDSSAAVTEVHRSVGGVKKAVDGAVKAYAELERDAHAAIQRWRRTSTEDADELREVAKLVIRKLMRARRTYVCQLATLEMGLWPLRLSGTGEAAEGSGWEGGRAGISGVGSGKGWTAQGLAFDGDDLLMTSYYDLDGDDTDADGNRSRLTYVDYETGAERKNVYLGGTEGKNSPCLPPPNHAGGVATDGEHVWVTSTSDGHSQVYVYSKEELDNAKDGGKAVRPESVVETPASSYVSYAKGKLFVGKYTESGAGTLYEHRRQPRRLRRRLPTLGGRDLHCSPRAGRHAVVRGHGMSSPACRGVGRSEVSAPRHAGPT